MTINKKLILVTATVSLGILGGVLQSDKILQSVSNTAHAFSVPSKDITYVPSITANNNIEVDVEDDAVPANFFWNNNTKFEAITGSQIGTANDLNLGAWFNADRPKNMNVPVYKIDKGLTYAIRNAGITQDGESLDLIVTINDFKKNDTDTYLGGLLILNSNDVGNDSNNKYSSITIQAPGYHDLDFDYKIVSSKTKQPVKVATGTYWSDIDVNQGINESLSNLKMIMSTQSSDLKIDGKVLYSTNVGSSNGLNDVDKNSYIGVGTGSEFNVKFYNPYNKALNNTPAINGAYDQ